MMRVTLKLLGALDEFLPERASARADDGVDIGDGVTLREFIDQLGMPGNAEFFAFVNDDKVDEDAYAATALKDGDEVVLCSAIKGG